eukprot:SAG11_NODE_2307_length_3546_cov_2.779809_3_plen_152_part_00
MAQVLIWWSEGFGLLVSTPLLISCAGGQGCGVTLGSLWARSPWALARLALLPGPVTCFGLWLMVMSFQLGSVGAMMTVSSSEVVFAFFFQIAIVGVVRLLLPPPPLRCQTGRNRPLAGPWPAHRASRAVALVVRCRTSPRTWAPRPSSSRH